MFFDLKREEEAEWVNTLPLLPLVIAARTNHELPPVSGGYSTVK